MTPDWTDADLASMERDYRNHPDVADLIAGVRRVLALCDEAAPRRMGDGYLSASVLAAGDVIAALNDPNGATP